MLRLLVLLSLPLLMSFDFSPMSQSIEIGEGKKGAQFLIQNEGPSNIAVELSVFERKMDDVGEETLGKTQSISVFPPQIIIPPGEKRTIRVTYNDKDIPQVEKNFRVVAEQLPLNVDPKTKNKAGIKMLMKFVAALYVTPSDAKSELKLLSQKSNGKQMTLEIENLGTKHQLLTNPLVKYVNPATKGEIKAADLPGLAGENVLAGHKRKFIIKTDKVIPINSKLDIKVDD